MLLPETAFVTIFCKSTIAGAFVTAAQELLSERLVVDCNSKPCPDSGQDTDKTEPFGPVWSEGDATV